MEYYVVTEKHEVDFCGLIGKVKMEYKWKIK